MEAGTKDPKGLSAQEQFYRYFQHKIIAIQDQMERLGDKSLIGGERKDATDHCLANIAHLSAQMKEASSELPAHDLKTYSEAIKALQDKLTATQAAFAPKQKFAFKTKKNASAISLQDAAELAAQRRGQTKGLSSTNHSEESSFATTPVHLMTPPNETSTDHSPPILITISSRISSHIVLPGAASRAQAPCQITKLNTCCVDLSIPTSETAPFASLTINDITSSLLLCGSIAGPTHVTGVKRGVLLVSCRQFRMHECENVDVYLHCISRPIIEGCQNIRFSKLPDFYYNLLFPATKAPMPENLWDQVNDFNWLRSEPSPNWKILPPQDRVSESKWKEIIPGKSGKSITEILAVVNITNS